ncbi:unnamed protein product [Cyprideis torosa]|uniref:Uncharacterized protein n=1 Tax=Cyprideis torosa TaxID=163714 RepID=A0A7R8W393_9CRUS|nr:unnamed protein product [Cyprideis torosa]CAG0880596.1 unnamed protein product [Cyprideis torosa]
MEDLYYTFSSSSTTHRPAWHPLAAGSGEVLNISDPGSLPTSTEQPDQSKQLPFSTTQIVLIALVAGFLSLLTVLGNVMVMVSFKIDKQLQTISNYFLFSLAVADFVIGLISMPLFTVYVLFGYWPMGTLVCNAWLSLDYLVSNASVLNLLIISFDRYFSVTRPLTYRVRRTTKRAAFMISCAWIISLMLWPPWIYAWPYIEGRRTVPPTECYIQFLETNAILTLITAIAAFYIPVLIMIVLYWKIWRETERRNKDLTHLQADNRTTSKRSTSSDEAISATTVVTDPEAEWRRNRLQSVGQPDELEGAFMTSTARLKALRSQKHRGESFNQWRGCIRGDWIRPLLRRRHKGRNQNNEMGAWSPGFTTPASTDTNVSLHCTSLNYVRDPNATTSKPGPAPASKDRPQIERPATTSHAPLQNVTHKPAKRSHSSDSVYTILIQLPPSGENVPVSEKQPSIRMICEENDAGSKEDSGETSGEGNGNKRSSSFRRPYPPGSPIAALRKSSFVPGGSLSARGSKDDRSASPTPPRRPSHLPDLRIPLSAKIIAKPLGKKAFIASGSNASGGKKKKKSHEKKNTKKSNNGVVLGWAQAGCTIQMQRRGHGRTTLGTGEYIWAQEADEKEKRKMLEESGEGSRAVDRRRR